MPAERLGLRIEHVQLKQFHLAVTPESRSPFHIFPATPSVTGVTSYKATGRLPLSLYGVRTILPLQSTNLDPAFHHLSYHYV
jgi:hypothetical protein